MIKDIFCVLTFIGVVFLTVASSHAAEVVKVVHPYWEENVQIENQRFCRVSNNDCGTIVKEMPGIITVKWDKWGTERYRKGDGSYHLMSLEDEIDLQIEKEYKKLEYTFEHPFVKLNPYKRAPLSILIKFPTDKKAQITSVIKGLNGQKDIVRWVPGYQLEHTLELHGFYPGHENTVEIIARFEDGSEDKKTLNFQMSRYYGEAFYTVLSKKDKKDFYYFTFDGYVVDEYGHVRYAFVTDGAIAYYLNGEIVLESRMHGLSAYTLMGKSTGKYPYPKGFVSFQHGLNVMPNGNYLVLGRQLGLKALNDGVMQETSWDQLIELDKKTGRLVKQWDMGKVLNPDRKAIIHSPNTADENDWFHINSVAYDASDNTLVISGRHVGIVKINYEDGALKWVFGPHLGYEKSGRDGKGKSIEDKVLTAVDSNEKPYRSAVQKGYELRSDFKWPTRNHDAKIIGDGLFSLFDNSMLANDRSIVTTKDSVAVIYKVDPVKMTIRQIWSKRLGDYSAVGSGVTYMPKEKEVAVFISEIADNNSKNTYGKIQRYDYKTKEKLFEAILLKKGWIYRVDPFSWPDSN